MKPSLRIALILGLAVVLSAAAFNFLLYTPQVEEQAALEDEAAALESQAQQLRGEVARLQDLQRRQPETLAALERVARLIPVEPEQPTAVSELQRVALAAGVGVTSLTFTPPVPLVPAVPVDGEHQLGRMTTTMVLEGVYADAVEFFRLLEEDTPRAELVTTVSVAEGLDSFPSLATTWTGDLFTLVPATVDPAASAPAPAAAPAGDAPAEAEAAPAR